MLEKIFQDYLLSDRGKEVSLRYPIHDPDRDNLKFRMSDAGRCRLYRYWKRQGKEEQREPMSVQQLMAMETGNLFHAWAIQALQHQDVLISAECAIEDDDRIGHYDAIVRYANFMYLIDIKTISGKKAYFMNKNGSGPDRHHIYQLITYGQFLSVDKYWLLYINRDTLEIQEWPVDFKSWTNKVTEDWNPLFDAWKRQEEPEANPEQWECKFCPYEKGCDQSNLPF